MNECSKLWGTNKCYTFCPICGDYLEIILEAHTQKHNITVDEFIEKYPHLKSFSVNDDFKKSYECIFKKPGPKSTTFITYKGITKTIRKWSDQTGIPIHNLHYRLAKGWEASKILNTPVKKYHKKLKVDK